jgi:hypothetical protein
VEVIEAIRYHFPLSVQRAMLTNQLHTLEETLNLLKRVEVMRHKKAFKDLTASHKPIIPTLQAKV